MKTIVIGGCGHIGSYLVPRLVRLGMRVTAVSRGVAEPYHRDSAWNEVERLEVDRTRESPAAFAARIANLEPDAVVDLIAFTPESVRHMVDALRGRVGHYLFCSSIWTHGAATVVPAHEDVPKFPLDDYGTLKAACDDLLVDAHRRDGFPATMIMPGHISGPGWNIVNPVGNTDPGVFQRIGRGEEVVLPNFGMEILNHVHGDDVAQVFERALTHRNQALGERFHAVAADALTTFGYAQALYRWFGKEPNIRFLPWEEWRAQVADAELADASYLHLARSGTYSIEKARRLIGYQPRYSALETIYASVGSMVDRGVISL